MSIARRAPFLGAAIMVLAAGLAVPATAQAQETPITRERMTQYARAHRALNDARDEFHGKVGRIHDEQGRERARVEMEERVKGALEEYELTRAQYDEITLLISLDGDARTLFDTVMKELTEEGTGS